MLEQFIQKNFHSESEYQIMLANQIIEEYQAAGYTLTLRQLYYQFVARDLFTKKFRWNGAKYVRDPNGTINAQPNYDNLGKLLSDARLAGRIDWDAMEDRTRNLRGLRTFESPDDAMRHWLRSYHIDMWANQEVRLEVWIEKDALVGLVERKCNEYGIDFFSCRGYTSQSEVYVAGKRIKERFEYEGQKTIVLHFGDHDPSGIDMTRDNEDRLSMFAGFDVQVERLALNMDQVKQYNPPPNPAKLGDTRSGPYVKKYGNESWELDALEPRLIGNLIEQHARAAMNEASWQELQDKLAAHKDALKDGVDFVADPSAYVVYDEQNDASKLTRWQLLNLVNKG